MAAVGEASAVAAGDLVFAGAQLAVDADGRALHRGDVPSQARVAFGRLASLLDEAGSTLDDVVEITSYHLDTRAIEPVLEIGREHFPESPPAWTAVGAGALEVPGALVAIAAVARLGDEPKQCVVPDTIAWWRRYPMSAGCRKGDLLFVAGQLGSDADGNVNVQGDHGAQARNALNRVREVCELSGAGLDDVLDVRSFHQDPRGIEPAAAVYQEEFFDTAAGPAFPAWTAVGSPGLLRFGMLGQYQAVAQVGAGRRVAGTPPDLGWGDVHASGAVRKEHGSLVAVAGMVSTQAESAFERMAAALGDVGSSLEDVVSVTSFHLDIRSADAVRAAAAGRFATDRTPAWTAVGMTGFWRPGQLHSIRAVAVI